MTDAAPEASAPNPFVRLAAASRGDVGAQRAFVLETFERLGLADIHFGDFEAARERAGALMERFDVVDGALLIEALVFARMAAVQGDERDRDRLVALLSIGSLLLPSEIGMDMIAEQIARASLRADERNAPGDAEAIDLLVSFFTEEAPPAAVAKAHLCRKLLIESGAA